MSKSTLVVSMPLPINLLPELQAMTAVEFVMEYLDLTERERIRVANWVVERHGETPSLGDME